jgi:RHS repeat-associated protein
MVDLRSNPQSRASSGLAYTTQKVEHRHSIGGLALKTFTEQAGVTSEDTVYYLKDHLGSITALVGKDGVVKERYSFDAWGARRDATTWADSAFDKLTKVTATNRGYTGHEMLDEIGLVHMNGRIYDPEIGRVLSGDPLIQAPDNSQSFNRYSYCINNPLSLTDPSGYSWFSKLWKKFTNFLLKPFRYVNRIEKMHFRQAVKWLAEHQWAAIVVAVVVGIVTFGVGLYVSAAIYGGAVASVGAGIALVVTGGVTLAAAGGVAGLVVAGAIGGFLAGGINAALAGGEFKDILKGAIIGGIQGAASAGIGHSGYFGEGVSFGSKVAMTVAHGVLGGTINEVMGGSFQDGFLSAAAGKGATFLPGIGGFLSPGADKADTLSCNILTRTALAGVIGGTASALGGGKFANGAYTAAMQHLFNEEAAKVKKGVLNLLNNKDRTERSMLMIEKIRKNGYFVVAGHGSPDFIEDQRTGVVIWPKPLSAKDLAQMIIVNGGTDGKSVWLWSCNTGEVDKSITSFAQNLANELHVNVVGPSAYVAAEYTRNPNYLDVTTIFASSPDTKYKVEGYWKTFYAP